MGGALPGLGSSSRKEVRNVSTQPPCYLPSGHVLQKSTKSAKKAKKAPKLAIGVCRKVRIKRTKRIKSPHLLFAFVEKCGKSEVSELSPVWGQHSLKTGRSFCLRATYWRTSRRVIGTLLILPGMASGGHPVVRFFQIVKDAHSRARTERTLLYGGIRHFDCHFTVCYTQVIMPASTDAFPVVGGRCTGRPHQCKAKQGRRGKTTLKFGY